MPTHARFSRCIICHKKSSDQEISFHAFPKNVEVCKKWIRFVRLSVPQFEYPTKTSYVCSDHFEPHCINHNPVKESLGFKVKKYALPGMFPTLNPFPPNTKKPSSKLPKNVEAKSVTSNHSCNYNLNKPAIKQETDVDEDLVIIPKVEADITEMPDVEGEYSEIMNTQNKLKNISSSTSITTLSNGNHAVMLPSDDHSYTAVVPSFTFSRRNTGNGSTIQAIPRSGIIEICDKQEQCEIIGSSKRNENQVASQCDILESPEITSAKSKKKLKEASKPEMQNRIFTVTDSNLMELFSICNYCLSRNCQGEITNINITIVEITQNCPECGHKRVWNSQTRLQRPNDVLSEQNSNTNHNNIRKNTDQRALYLL